MSGNWQRIEGDYDYFADPLGAVDPTTIDEVISEAESFTAKKLPSFCQRLGRHIMTAFEYAGQANLGLFIGFHPFYGEYQLTHPDTSE